MIIRTEKFVDVAGCKARRILSVEGVPLESEIPAEYDAGSPIVYQLNDGRVYVYDEAWRPGRPGYEYIKLGSLGTEFSEERFQEVLRAIREAAKRLRNINEERREILEKWCGEETILI